jgi:hypothetical protein
MRRLLGRKAVTIIAAIVSFTAIPVAGVVTTAAPALASVNICNSFGHKYCAGAPSLNNGDPVVLTSSGRAITEWDQGFTAFGGMEVFRLQFTAAPSQCMGIAASGNITLRDCSGGNSNNTNWAKEFASGGIVWISTTHDTELTSNNALGAQLFEDGPGCSGCYLRWNN